MLRMCFPFLGVSGPDRGSSSGGDDCGLGIESSRGAQHDGPVRQGNELWMDTAGETGRPRHTVGPSGGVGAAERDLGVSALIYTTPEVHRAGSGDPAYRSVDRIVASPGGFLAGQIKTKACSAPAFPVDKVACNRSFA